MPFNDPRSQQRMAARKRRQNNQPKRVGELLEKLAREAPDLNPKQIDELTRIFRTVGDRE